MQGRYIGLKIVLFLLVLFAFDRVIAQVLSHGLNQYYGLAKNAQILCVGYSHTVLGIDASSLQKSLQVPVAKYAISGANAVDRFEMVRHYIDLNPGVKILVYDVDSRLFDVEGISSGSHSLFFPFIDHPVIAKYLSKAVNWKSYWITKLVHTTRFRDQTINIAIRGLLNRIENEKTSVFDKEKYQRYLERAQQRDVVVNLESLDRFYKTLAYATSKGIKVFLAYIPVIDLINDIDRSGYDRVVSIFKDAAYRDDHIFFLNYNEQYEHQHNIFYDPRHLNREGKRQITRQLINDLRNHVYGRQHASAAHE